MEVTKLEDGFWRWTGFHEEWKQDVGALYLEQGGDVVLVDPIVPRDGERKFLSALDRDVAKARGKVHVVVTVFWHARDTREIAKRYRARVWALGAARRAVARRAPVTDTFRVGDVLPGGFEARSSGRGTEVVLWLPSRRSMVFGDVVLGAADGKALRLCPESWLPEGRTHADVRAALAPLRELPVTRLLVSHGKPVLSGGKRALASLLG